LFAGDETPEDFSTAALVLLFPIGLPGDRPQGAGRIAMASEETGLLQVFPADGLKIRWRMPVGRDGPVRWSQTDAFL
jgi:hypothetical protein